MIILLNPPPSTCFITLRCRRQERSESCDKGAAAVMLPRLLSLPLPAAAPTARYTHALPDHRPRTTHPFDVRQRRLVCSPRECICRTSRQHAHPPAETAAHSAILQGRTGCKTRPPCAHELLPARPCRCCCAQIEANATSRSTQGVAQIRHKQTRRAGAAAGRREGGDTACTGIGHG
jgi:hypothetical protein